MERINRILQHELFLEHLEKNIQAEKERRFCRHDMSHFLDVARIGRIMNLEESLGIEEEMLYAAALLHDLGRHIQYDEGIPHEQAGAEIAAVILRDCGFGEAETAAVADAVAGHRDSGMAEEKSLGDVLYRADKASRPCFACEAEKDCNWKKEKKNLEIRY